MELDADFEAVAALLADGPEGVGVPEEAAPAADEGDFEQAVALLLAPDEQPRPAAPAGFAQHSPALLQYARTMKEKRRMRSETEELKAKLESLSRRLAMSSPCRPWSR